MPRTLKKIVVERIALCDAAATRKKFFVKKRRQEMEKLIELLKSLHGEDEITEEAVKSLKGIPEKQITELESALAVATEYKKLYPDEVLEAIELLSKHATYGRAPGSDDNGDEPTAEDALELLTTFEESDIEKAGKKVSKETESKLRTIMKIIQGILGNGDEGDKKKMEKKYKDLPEEVQEELKELAKLRKEKEDAETEKQKEEKKKAKEKQDDIEKRLKALEDGFGHPQSFDVDEDMTDDEKKSLIKAKEEVKFPSLIRGLHAEKFKKKT